MAPDVLDRFRPHLETVLLQVNQTVQKPGETIKHARGLNPAGGARRWRIIDLLSQYAGGYTNEARQFADSVIAQPYSSHCLLVVSLIVGFDPLGAGG
jgi:hypothetical protein